MNLRSHADALRVTHLYGADVPLERHPNRSILRCGDCGTTYMDSRPQFDLTSPVRAAEAAGWKLGDVDGVRDWKCLSCATKPPVPPTPPIPEGGGKEKQHPRPKEKYGFPEKVPWRSSQHKT
jgi:hypothetical protein